MRLPPQRQSVFSLGITLPTPRLNSIRLMRCITNKSLIKQTKRSYSMKVKIVVIISLLLGAALVAGCGIIPGLGSNSNTPPSTPIGPINSSYSNAISPAQQLILGTINLQGNLVITPNEAAQLVPLWEAYQTLSISNTASPLELQATLVQVEQTMTPDQVQSIVNMKLTRQDMGTIFQQLGISFGGRGTGT